LNFNRLLEYCPSATGEVQVLIDGQWHLLRIDEKEVPIPSGPMICYVQTEGIDLGVGFALTLTKPVGGHSSQPAESRLTQRAVNRMQKLLRVPTPIALWYEVEVTNPENGQSGFYKAIIDTGSSRSTFPEAWKRLGVESGGHERTITQLGEAKVAAGVVKVRLVRKALEKGLDKHGDTIWDYEDLPTQLISSMKQQESEIIARLEGDVAVIGLNNLDAWGLQVHPVKGLVHCDDAKVKHEEL